MQRRKFSREFKFEAVTLVLERGVSAAQAARDLGVYAKVLRKWIREAEGDPGSAFPGHGNLRPEQLAIERLRRELPRMKAERDILKKAAAYFAKGVRVHVAYLADLLRKYWWSRGGSNPRPLQCHRSALPAELRPHQFRPKPVRERRHYRRDAPLASSA